MKDVAKRALLLDFYGPLLTDKQREIYDWYYQQDLSLGEIGELTQVSRNAVYDLITRTDEKLERYEELLGLIEAHDWQGQAREALAADFEAWLGQVLEDGASAGVAGATGQLPNQAQRAAFAALVHRLRQMESL